MTPRYLPWLCLLALVTGDPDTARAESYPNKPVRLVTAAAGAGGDFVSRMVAPGLTELWGHPVIVDNRGGSAVIPIEVVAKAPPDGYTLLAFGTALWHLPLMQSVSYDPIRDFAPITLVATTPMVKALTSGPSSSPRSRQAKPGSLPAQRSRVRAQGIAPLPLPPTTGCFQARTRA